MSEYGKSHRLKRLFGGGRILIMAMDHGIQFGEQEGLYDIEGLIKTTSKDIDAVILNKGIIDTLSFDILDRVGLIFKLNGITSRSVNPYDLVLISTVEEALSYDPVAVSYELYIGGEQENRKIEELSGIIRESNKFGIPIISHIYPQGENKNPDIISHCIRLGWELGSDVIKTFYYGGMHEQVTRTRKPILIAGGEKFQSIGKVEEYVKKAMASGVKGIAMGRNLWGWGEKTPSLVKRIANIVHNN